MAYQTEEQKKRKANKYLSILQPVSVPLNGDEEEQQVDEALNDSGEYQPAQGLKDSYSANQQPVLAGSSVISGARSVPQPTTGSTPTTDQPARVKPLSKSLDFQLPISEQQPLTNSLRNTITFDNNSVVNKYRPLNGQVTDALSTTIARGIDNPMDTPLSNSDINVINRAKGVDPSSNESLTPEQKLQVALSNTNPTPRSFWRRLAAGAARGAASIDPNNDSIGTALGRIAGAAGAQAVPQVDSALQYERNKQKALETYRVESAVRDAAQKQTQISEATRRANETLAETKRKNEEQRNEQLLANKAKLRGEKRAEATQRLQALRGLPPDDNKRLELAKELRDNYGINVSSNYGVSDTKRATEPRPTKVYDTQSGNYVYLKADGTYLQDKEGNTVIAQPGEKEETPAASAAISKREREGQQGTVESIARSSVDARKDEFIKRLSEKHQKALNDPSTASPSVLKEARAELKAITDEEYKRALDYTKGEAARQDAQATGQRKGNSTSNPKTSGASTGSRLKVPPTPKASSTNFKSVTLR